MIEFLLYSKFKCSYFVEIYDTNNNLLAHLSHSDKVSFCDRPSSVCRLLTITREHNRDRIFQRNLAKLAHNLYWHKISVPFENQPDPIMTCRVKGPTFYFQSS